jgi:type VI secretion system protein VasG
MAKIKRSILSGRLNPIAFKAIDSATIFSKMRGNPYVELVHWLNQIFQLADSDLHKITKHSGLNISRLAANLLKPALARGTLRTIPATAWAEYKKYFEKDLRSRADFR